MHVGLHGPDHALLSRICDEHFGHIVVSPMGLANGWTTDELRMSALMASVCQMIRDGQVRWVSTPVEDDDESCEQG